jgi:hypothetical protein
MVVEDDHETDFSKSGNGDVEYLHAGLPNELGVRLQVFSGDRLVVIEHLKRVGEPDAIHLEFVPDVMGDFPQGAALQAIDAMPAHMRA